MSYTAPTIIAVCDEDDCDNELEITLTEISRGWDSRYADQDLLENDWKIAKDGSLTCDCCVVDMENECLI